MYRYSDTHTRTRTHSGTEKYLINRKLETVIYMKRTCKIKKISFSNKDNKLSENYIILNLISRQKTDELEILRKGNGHFYKLE